MMLAIAVAASALAAVQVPAPEGALPVRITEPWTIELGPGRVDTPEGARELRQAVSVNIAPVELVQVRGEEHNPLPLFDPNAGSWRRGAKLKQLIAEECTGTGLAVPSSIRLTSQPGAAETFVADTDYVVDAFWAQIGRIEGGAIAPDQAVYVDYDYYPTRVDSILVDASGGVRVAQGKPGVGNIHLPEPGTGEVAVCTVWHNGILAGLEPENVFPIQFAATSTRGPRPVRNASFRKPWPNCATASRSPLSRGATASPTAAGSRRDRTPCGTSSSFSRGFRSGSRSPRSRCTPRRGPATAATAT